MVDLEGAELHPLFFFFDPRVAHRLCHVSEGDQLALLVVVREILLFNREKLTILLKLFVVVRAGSAVLGD